MYPELFQLDLPVVGEVTISSFGVMMAAAFLVGYWLLRVQLREFERDEELAYDMLLGAVIGGIVGAKLYFVVQHAIQTPAGFFELLTARAGLTWYGGFIGGALGVVWAARRRDADLGFVADLASPVLALSYAIGRIGCFLVGDDYGRPTESWVGVASFWYHHTPLLADVCSSPRLG
ncbi:MAG: prolipoprotein diacylglyceryl transferase, partial [Gemmatimonadota bacterium]